MILVLKKVKSPYVTSVAQNGHVTHKPEADGALILPPLPSPFPPPPLPPHSLSVLRVFETTPRYTERKGSMVERLERWTCNSETPSSSPALTASWICSR